MQALLALFLDLDDVLVMSEELVRKASCSLINETLQQKGVMRQYTPDELKEQFVGLGFTSIMRALGLQHGFAISPDELHRLDALDLALITKLLEAEVEPSPGALEMLSQVRDWGVTCAVVSSSEPVRIKACLRRTGLALYLPEENLFSASDPLAKLEGKPSPAIYNHAVKVLGITPDQCLAVEDSPRTGVLAAVRAKIEVVGYAGAESLDRQAQRNRMLIEAGAAAAFSDWPSFLAWLRPRVCRV